MSTAQRAEPGTEIQLAEKVAIGTLPPEFQQALEMRKLQNQVAGQLASLNWGKGLDLNTRRAIADFGQQFRVDTTTEIDLLGGNVYLKAVFYLRQLSELIAQGLVEYAIADHIEEDPRLARLGPDGEGEISRRLRERIRYGVPDKAASAVVFRVKLRSMDKEVVGIKFCGNGVRKNDPVGEDKPQETSETRAARRCMRLLSSHVPPATARQIEAVERAAELLSARVEHARHEVHEQNDAIEARRIAAGRSHVPASQAPLLNAGDPYSPIDETRLPVGAEKPDVATVVAPQRTDAQRALVDRVANQPDPFAPTSQSSAKPGSTVRIPFDHQDIPKQTAIANIPTPALAAAVKWARGEEKYAAFVEAADEELERRRVDDEAEG